jgi:GT2 family glycosyltransferase
MRFRLGFWNEDALLDDEHVMVNRTLVSVIVPCFNAAVTLSRTLDSARAQTHKHLEIIVVDDGSTDGSAEVAEAHGRIDPRVTVVRQTNGGVAAARNTGIAAARGRFVAPLDADDIWHPDKIVRQLALAEDDAVTLVYCWAVLVDPTGRVISDHARSTVSGHVVPALLRDNFLGNGSTVLIRREAALRVGGYDASLRARGAQGCEDWLLGLQMAEIGEIRVVPDFLVGYLVSAGNMSSNGQAMLRSTEIVAADFAQRYPQHAPALRAHVADAAYWHFMRAVSEARPIDALTLLRRLFGTDPKRAAVLLSGSPLQFLRQVASALRRLGGGAGRRTAQYQWLSAPGTATTPGAVKKPM